MRLSEDADAVDSSTLPSACTMGLEGIIAKRRDKPYHSGRSPTGSRSTTRTHRPRPALSN